MLRFLSSSCPQACKSLHPLRRQLSSTQRIINIGSLVTPSATGTAIDTHHNCELKIDDGRVVEIVTSPSGSVDHSVGNVLDARGGLVTPGFIDAHTHLMPPTDRANEFAMRYNSAIIFSALVCYVLLMLCCVVLCYSDRSSRMWRLPQLAVAFCRP